jgi:hypothetical protein
VRDLKKRWWPRATFPTQSSCTYEPHSDTGRTQASSESSDQPPRRRPTIMPCRRGMRGRLIVVASALVLSVTGHPDPSLQHLNVGGAAASATGQPRREAPRSLPVLPTQSPTQAAVLDTIKQYAPGASVAAEPTLITLLESEGFRAGLDHYPECTHELGPMTAQDILTWWVPVHTAPSSLSCVHV